MHDEGVPHHQVGSSSSAWSALIIGAIAGVVPLVVSASQSSAVWQDGRLVESHYRDNVALFGGLTAIVCGALVFVIARGPSAARTKLLVGAAALVLLGGWHSARGLGWMHEPAGQRAAAKGYGMDVEIERLERFVQARVDAAPPVTPATCPDARVCNELGRSLEDTDKPGALEAYLRGCELGGRGNCHNAASYLADGYGVPEDDARAVGLYEQACKMGMTLSCVDLGEMLHSGEGVTPDVPRAVTLFEQACVVDHSLGCFNLGVARNKAGDAAGAQQGFIRACELGRGVGCDVAGLALYTGDGVTKDPAAARTLFEQACAAKEEPRCFNLALAHDEGNGGPEDAAKARQYYEPACAADHPGACNNLGLLHSEGRGGPKDIEQARLLFQRACDLGSDRGCGNLTTLPAPPP